MINTMKYITQRFKVIANDIVNVLSDNTQVFKDNSEQDNTNV